MKANDQFLETSSQSESQQGNPGVPAVSCERVTDRRIERIEEFLQDSLESEDARRAAFNGATADLMLIGYRLAGSIKADIGDREVDLEEWDDLMPAVHALSVVNRLIAQFDHVDRRLTELDEPKRGMRERRRIGDEKSPK